MAHDSLLHSRQFTWIGLTLILGAIAPLPTAAQVMPDTTLGAESSVVTPGTIREVVSDRISGGVQRGQNLFHSFSQFSIPAGQGAYFENPAGVENIFSRVTGSTPSNILGRLGVVQAGSSTELGNANLFLINPNGILFGRDATLDLAGSFTATTANAIEFGDRGSFSAANPGVPAQLLTINPSAYLFNRLPIGNIESRSTAPSVQSSDYLGLRVDNRKNLTLLGGNITINGGGEENRAGLNAFGGRIDLGAVVGLGRVELNANGGLRFPSTLQRADVLLTNRGQIDVSSRDRGDISITARNLRFENSSRLFAGIFEGLGTVTSQAGNIQIDSTGGVALLQSSFIENNVGLRATGRAGDIEIRADSLTVRDGSQISSSTLSQGDAGNIFIDVNGRVLFSGTDASGEFPSAALTNIELDGRGRGGNININASSLLLQNGAQLQTLVRRASSASTTEGGRAGDITLNIRENVLITGRGPIRNPRDGGLPSLLSSELEPGRSGAAGDISINASSLNLSNGGRVTSRTLGRGSSGDINVKVNNHILVDGGEIFSTVGQRAVTSGREELGDIKISANSVELRNDSFVSASTFGQGNAGSITLEVRDQTSMRDGSTISSRVGICAECANVDRLGGNIQISTNILNVEGGSDLNTSTSGFGNAGSIFIHARDRVSFDRSNAFVTVEKGSTGQGGNISVNTNSLSLTNGSQLTATTFSTGDAGSVTITAQGQVTFDGLSDDGEFASGVRSAVNQGATGRSGSIQISAAGIQISNDAAVSTRNSSSDNAGSISLIARDEVFLSPGFVTAVSRNSDGGNISISGGAIIAFAGSGVTTDAGQNGGNISLNSPVVLIEGGYRPITRETPPEDTPPVFISATGNFPGDVRAPDISFIENSLTDLQQPSIDPDRLIATSCIARTDRGGTFLITGSGAFRDRPGDLPRSNYPTGTVRPLPETTAPGTQSSRPWQPGDPIVEPQGVYRLANGRLVMSQECS